MAWLFGRRRRRRTVVRSASARAIVIGIDYSGDIALSGCVSDARCVREFAASRGLRDDQITLLCNEDATRDNILGALARAAADSKRNPAGYALWLHYSGHGLQLEDRDADESDGMDECLVTWDRKVVLDDELRALLGCFHPGARITATVDACHSGSIMDLPYRYDAESGGFVPCESRRQRGEPWTGPAVLCLSGCPDAGVSMGEVATARSSAARAYGFLTSAVLDAMGTTRDAAALVQVVSDRLRVAGQTPVLTSSSARAMAGLRFDPIGSE